MLVLSTAFLASEVASLLLTQKPERKYGNTLLPELYSLPPGILKKIMWLSAVAIILLFTDSMLKKAICYGSIKQMARSKNLSPLTKRAVLSCLALLIHMSTSSKLKRVSWFIKSKQMKASIQRPAYKTAVPTLHRLIKRCIALTWIRGGSCGNSQ